MTVMNQLWRCPLCGNLLECVFPGDGTLFCCGRPMELQIGNTGVAPKIKHVPFLYEKEGKLCIRIGETPHPMTEQHYIAWIEIRQGGYSVRKELHPGDAAEWETCFPYENGIQVRCFCNLDGVYCSETVSPSGIGK